jgi:hypothetical protein
MGNDPPEEDDDPGKKLPPGVGYQVPGADPDEDTTLSGRPKRSKLRRAYDRVALGITTRDWFGDENSYMKLAAIGPVDRRTGQKTLTDAQIDEALMVLILEKGYKKIYCYRGNSIDSELRSRVTGRMLVMCQPGGILHQENGRRQEFNRKMNKDFQEYCKKNNINPEDEKDPRVQEKMAKIQAMSYPDLMSPWACPAFRMDEKEPWLWTPLGRITGDIAKHWGSFGWDKTLLQESLKAKFFKSTGWHNPPEVHPSQNLKTTWNAFKQVFGIGRGPD